MMRETLKPALLEALRKQKSTLASHILEAPSTIEDEESLIDVCSELTAVNSLIKSLESSYDPFMEFIRQDADGTTLYEISERDVEIIGADIDGFLFKVVHCFKEQLSYLADKVLDAKNMWTRLITVIDRMSYSHKKNNE